MNIIRVCIFHIVTGAIVLLLTGCLGSSESGPPPDDLEIFDATVGGTISGLESSETVGVSSNRFRNAQSKGSSFSHYINGSWSSVGGVDARFRDEVNYKITLSNQPPGKVCVITQNAEGDFESTAHENIDIVCTTVVISTTTDLIPTSGIQGNGDTNDPDISNDGSRMGMTSVANNLVPGDDNGQRDVFVVDSLNGTTTRVTVAAGSTNDPFSGISGSSEARVSSDGRYTIFSSTDASAGKPAQGTAAKVEADTNNVSDIFLYDNQADDTIRVSVPNLADQGTLGTEADSSSSEPAMSGDGRYLVFWSNARNLVTGDTNLYADIFLHDRQTGATTRISVPNLADQGTLGTEAAGVSFNAGNSFSPSVSDDGRYVAFRSQATNLVLNDSSGDSTSAYLKGTDIFFHDTQTGETTRVSVPNLADQGTLGTEANNNSGNPEISADGRYVVFQSDATNLVTGDTNNVCDNNFSGIFDDNCTDIFLFEVATGVVKRLSVDFSETQSNGACRNPSISNEGLFVAFECTASNLVTDDTNGFTDIFVHNTVTGEIALVSIADDGTQGDGSSENASISGDGQYIAYDSAATTLVTGDANGFKDVFRTPNPIFVVPAI